jgi:tocopherol O-methyltransferase
MTDQQAKVLHYYQATGSDYKRFWFSPKDLAIHFGYYDASIRSHSSSLLKMNEVLAEIGHINIRDRVLDAGCGYGGSSFWLAENKGCEIIGISLVSEQVQEAKHVARQRHLEHLVSFEQMDFCATAFPDASFDVVWFLESAVHAPHKDALLAEAYRLLRPAGRLLVAEYMLCEQVSQEEYQQLVPWLDGWAMASLLSVSEYHRLLSEAGFGAVKCQDITEHVRLSINRLGKLRLPTLPTAQVIAWMLPGLCLLGYSKIRLANIKAGICQNKALRQGLWRYVILCATKESVQDAREGQITPRDATASAAILKQNAI